MSLIHPAILYGLGLAAIPVILHFLLRTKPKKLLFPALRLIQVRRKSNVRRLHLRHIWLLLLRIAVIVTLVLAIARPSLPAANYALNLRESLTMAAIALVAAGVYTWVLKFWRRKRLSNHLFTYQRTMLRGGTGLALALLLLLLVAWPYQHRIAAEISAPAPSAGGNLQVAAVFLFDTSLSMQYRYENKTRLEVARVIAGEHLSGLPSGSRIAVAETSTDTPILFQSDRTGAQTRIDSLEVQVLGFPINDRLQAAVRLQEEDYRRTLDVQESVPDDLRKDQYRREIYLFTDLSRSSWRMGSSKFLRDELSRLEWIQVYLIDVGVEAPTNVGISSLRLSTRTLPQGGELIVQATLDVTGMTDTERIIELYVQNDIGKLVKQGQLSVKFESELGASAAFSVRGLTGPIGQGEVRLISSDPMTGDDVRYFTVAVRPPPEILVVAELRSETDYLFAALAPDELDQRGQARYRATYLPASKLSRMDLRKYDVVCLVNVQAPPEDAWNALGNYVESGGGLAVFLGNRRVSPVAYNRDIAQAFLPGELLAYLKFSQPALLDLPKSTHLMLRKFQDFGGFGDLTSAEIHRYWKVKPNAHASLIAAYTNPQQSPAFLDRSYGNGRTVMFTTAVDLKGWSDLPRTRWFVALADQMMQYLGSRSNDVFNYVAGEDIILRLDPAEPIRQYLLRKPGLQQVRGLVPQAAEYLTISDADQVGHYEVVAAEDETPFTKGFSVNPLAGESDFTRIRESDLDGLLGQDRYEIAKGIRELERKVYMGRIGQEIFSLVLMCMIVVFCAEHVVANKFYEAN